MNRLWLGMGLMILIITLQPVSAYDISAEFMSSTGEMTSTLDEFDGKYIVLDAMATWCGPCRLEMVHLNDVHEVIKDEDEVELFTMSMDPTTDTITKVGDFMEQFDATWEYSLDINEELKSILNVTGYPTTFIFSPEGEILQKWLGLTEASVILEELDRYLDLPGAIVRGLNIDDFLDSLFNSPFFFIFMIMLWITIFYAGYNLINKVKPTDVSEN